MSLSIDDVLAMAHEEMCGQKSGLTVADIRAARSDVQDLINALQNAVDAFPGVAATGTSMAAPFEIAKARKLLEKLAA